MFYSGQRFIKNKSKESRNIIIYNLLNYTRINVSALITIINLNICNQNIFIHKLFLIILSIEMYIFFFNLETYSGPVTIKDMQTPHPPPLTFDQPIMDDGVYSMKKIIQKFSDFYFSSYCEKFIEN